MTKKQQLNRFGAVCTSKHPETYKELAVVAILILSVFPTTVMCERSFSAPHFIENKYRNQLTNINLETYTAGEKCDRISFRKSPANFR
jgi:hypothetical protein